MHAQTCPARRSPGKKRGSKATLGLSDEDRRQARLLRNRCTTDRSRRRTLALLCDLTKQRDRACRVADRLRSYKDALLCRARRLALAAAEQRRPASSQVHAPPSHADCAVLLKMAALSRHPQPDFPPSPAYHFPTQCRPSRLPLARARVPRRRTPLCDVPPPSRKPPDMPAAALTPSAARSTAAALRRARGRASAASVAFGRPSRKPPHISVAALGPCVAAWRPPPRWNGRLAAPLRTQTHPSRLARTTARPQTKRRSRSPPTAFVDLLPSSSSFAESSFLAS